MYISTDYTPLVSVVIPVKNGQATLGACLRSIKRSYYKNIEVIVVDDHSTDETAGIARQFNCIFRTLGDGGGANAARNLGAAEAKGDVFVFIDSDVVVRRETILGIVERLEEEYVDAVVGIYTAKHSNDSIISQYKNLWVRYSYIKSPPSIDWLFGAISGVKKPVFEKIGGFNTDLLSRHGNDDIELGKRFAREKLNIVLDMEIEVEHLKRYTLWTFIKNEFIRSFGFVELANKMGEVSKSLRYGFVNVYPAFIISTLLPVAIVVALYAILAGSLSWWALAAVFGVHILVNIRFLNYLEQVRGFFAMIVMIPILVLDHFVCLLGAGAGFIKSIFTRRK